MVVKQEDILLVQVGDENLYVDCMKGKDWDDLQYNQIAKKEDVEETDFVFCDKCGNQVK